MKKALIPMVLAGAVVSGIGQAAPAKDVTATVSITQQVGQHIMATTEQAVSRFKEKYPNVTIETRYVPTSPGSGGWGEYNNAFLNQVAAGNAPDIIYSAIEGFAEMSSKGVLRDMDVLVDKDPTAQTVLKGIDGNLLKGMRTKGSGELNFFPTEWNNVVMYYNKDMFDAAGVAYPKAGWSWDDFAKTAKALTLRDSAGKVTQYGAFVPGYVFGLMPWFLTNDANILDAEWKQPTVDTVQFRESLQFLYDLIYVQKSAPSFEAGVGTEKFTAGQVAMFAAGHWPARAIKDSGLVNVGVQYMPQKVRQTTVFGTGGLAITKQSKNPELAWEFIKEMTGDEYQQQLADIGASIPSARKFATTPEYVAWPENSEIFYQSAATAIPMPSPPNYAKFNEVFDRHIATYLNNEVSLDATISSLDRDLKRAMKRAYR